MDNELKEILVKLLEGQTRLEDKVSGIENKVDGLEAAVKKNSIKLETIEKKIDVIAEVQTAHKDQNQKQHNEIIEPLGNKVDVIELAVRDISNDIKAIREDLTSVELITAKNYSDIVKLKAVK